MTLFSPGVEIHIHGSQPTKSQAPASYTSGRAQRKRLRTTDVSATTSCSWVSALRLRSAGKCSFSFEDYKIHGPNGENTHNNLIMRKQKLALCGHSSRQAQCYVHEAQSLEKEWREKPTVQQEPPSTEEAGTWWDLPSMSHLEELPCTCLSCRCRDAKLPPL